MDIVQKSSNKRRKSVNKSTLKKWAKQLKSKGLVNYDLRTKLTPYKRKRIIQLMRKYNTVFNHKNEFFVRKLPKNSQYKFKTCGYYVVGDYVYLSKSGYAKCRISKRGKYFVIVRSNGEKRQIEFVSKPWEIFAILENSSWWFKPKAGRFITCKFSNGGAFAQIFDTPEKLLKYLESLPGSLIDKLVLIDIML